MDTEIIIIGGGLTGLLISNILEKMKISNIILEKRNIGRFISNLNEGRVLAITQENKKLLEKYDLWDLVSSNSGPIEQIRVTDQYSPMFLHFDNTYVNNENLGYMTSANDLMALLYSNLKNAQYSKIIEEIDLDDVVNNENDVSVLVKGQGRFNGKLLIAADGKNSYIREKFKFATFDIDYKQTAIVCNVSHEKNHNNIAHEIFLPSGPFAILPIMGGYKSAIVWTESSKYINTILSLSEARFTQELNKRFTDFLGPISLESKIFHYPLSAKITKKYFLNRVCLVGDAAHYIHPIAGQGFNQAMRDIKSLTELIDLHHSTKMDIGSKILLESYQNSRMIDNASMLIFTDVIHRIFSNNVPILRNLRKLGLFMINKSQILQTKFMKYAMGKR